MDPALMALCREVLEENVDSDEFATLLLETGVNIDGLQWDVASKLLNKGDSINYLSKRFGQTVH